MADWVAATGGVVRSADGQLRLTIPAGAFGGRRQVTIVDHPVSPTPPVVALPGRVVRSFSLTATDAAGQADTAAFAQPVQLSVQLDPGGFARTIAPQIALHVQNPRDHSWVRIPSQYDRHTMILRAALPHFSDYVATLVDGAAYLPTVDHFATDLNQGTASVSLPLKVPPGPHGFAPKLTLSYSSGGVNGIISDVDGL